MNRRIKIISLALLLTGAGFIFGVVCKEIGKVNNELILFPSRNHLVLLSYFLLALIVILVISGLIAVLLRPVWTVLLSFFLSGIAILVGWQVTAISCILIFIYLLTAFFYISSVTKKLNQQIKFSLKAVSRSQSILKTALILIACGSLYCSCVIRIQEEGFVLPESYIEIVIEQVEKRIEDPSSKEESQQSIDQLRKDLRDGIDDFFEHTVEPYEHYIPLILATSLFMSLLTITQLLSWLPIIIIQGILALLTKLEIIKITSETQKVERLIIA